MEIWGFCVIRGVYISAEHISGKETIIADLALRELKRFSWVDALLGSSANLLLVSNIFVSNPPTLQQPASWLPFMKNLSNCYYSLDYISPYLSSNHFKQLQWGFQLTHNTLFCEHIILPEYHPRNTSYPNLTSTLPTKTNNDFDFQYYSLYLPFIRPINQSQMLV